MTPDRAAALWPRLETTGLSPTAVDALHRQLVAVYREYRKPICITEIGGKATPTAQTFAQAP